MSKKEPDFGALLAAGALGLVGAFAAAAALKESRQARRDQFRQELAARLQPSGYELAQASLGLSSQGHHVWSLTLASPEEYIPFRLRLPDGIEPYSSEAMRLLLDNVGAST